ncbi:hypothetical protein D3C87_2114450 [compost metagenome]
MLPYIILIDGAAGLEHLLQVQQDSAGDQLVELGAAGIEYIRCFLGSDQGVQLLVIFSRRNNCVFHLFVGVLLHVGID